MFVSIRQENASERLCVPLGEYLLWRQPDLIWLFQEYGLSEEPMTKDALALKARLRESHTFWWWKRMMEERPKLGRAGILPWEVAAGD